MRQKKRLKCGLFLYAHVCFADGGHKKSGFICCGTRVEVPITLHAPQALAAVFPLSVSENQPCSVRNEGCYAMQRPPLSLLHLLLRPVLLGCSLLFAQMGPDETLVWRKCRPVQLQTGTHLSSRSPECQTVLCAGACSCLAYVACMPKNAPYAVCRMPAVS